MPISMLPAPPLRDVLDDEEMLAGTDVAERPRFLHQDRRRRCTPKVELEPRVLPLELSHGGDPNRALRTRVHEVVQRSVVEEPDQEQRADRKPATRDRAADAPTPLLFLRSHLARSSAGVSEVLWG
jgi:hypothetical protein